MGCLPAAASLVSVPHCCVLQMGHTVESTPVQEADKLRQHASTIGHMAVMLMPLAKLHAEISK